MQLETCYKVDQKNANTAEVRKRRAEQEEQAQQDRDQAAEEEEFLREQRKHEAQKSDKAATNTRIRIDNGLKVGAARLTL